MSRDRALANALVAACLSGAFITLLSGFGPGSVFGPISTGACIYLLLTSRRPR